MTLSRYYDVPCGQPLSTQSRVHSWRSACQLCADSVPSGRCCPVSCVLTVCPLAGVALSIVCWQYVLWQVLPCQLCADIMSSGRCCPVSCVLTVCPLAGVALSIVCWQYVLWQVLPCQLCADIMSSGRCCPVSCVLTVCPLAGVALPVVTLPLLYTPEIRNGSCHDAWSQRRRQKKVIQEIQVLPCLHGS